MPSFNKVILIGNLTRDPVLKHTDGGATLCSFGLAVNQKFKTKAGDDKEKVLFANCTAWGKLAEIVAKWMKKGRPLLVEGTLENNDYEDKEGVKHKSFQITVRSVQFLGGKQEPKESESGSEEAPF